MRLTVEAKPGKKISSITVRAGTIIVAVRERAVDGKANAAIERALAQWFGVAPQAVTIVRGASGRRKIVDVAGLTEDAFARQIAGRDGAG